MLTTSSADGPPIQQWDVATGRQAGPALRAPADSIWFAYGPNSQLLSCAYSGNSVQLWNVSANREIGAALPLTVPARETENVAVSPDLQYVAEVSDSGAVYEQDIATGRAVGVPFKVSTSAFRMALGPGGNLLALANPSVVTLWDMADGQQEGASLPVPGGVGGMTFSPDGTTLATIGDDGTTRLWDVDLYRQAGLPLTLPQGVYAEAFSPDGKTMATIDDNGIGLWNLTSATITAIQEGESPGPVEPPATRPGSWAIVISRR